MSGWRHFGIHLGDKPQAHSIMLGEEYTKHNHDRISYERGYLCIYIGGYGDTSMPHADPELFDRLKESDRRGYYLEMNDTTDTGEGVIRFEEESNLVDVCELVDKEIEEEEEYYDGPDSVLSNFQLGAPGTWTLYRFLEAESFPYVGLDR